MEPGSGELLVKPAKRYPRSSGADSVSSTVVVLRNPRLAGDDLSYEVRVLEGTLPAQSGPCSLFIDIIGMPLTPFSYVGAAGWSPPAASYPPAAYYPRPVAYYGPAVVHYGYPIVRLPLQTNRCPTAERTLTACGASYHAST